MPIKQNPSFIVYINRVSKEVHPNLNLSTDGKKYLQNLLISFIDHFLIYVSTMMDHNRVKTLSTRDVQSSVRVFFVGELAKHAISKAIMAVTKYTSYYPKKNGKKTSDSKKAGIIFSPSRVRSMLRNLFGDYKIDFRISSAAPVYLATVMEYLIDQLLEFAGYETIESKRTTISVKDIKNAIQKDEELRRTLCRLNEVP